MSSLPPPPPPSGDPGPFTGSPTPFSVGEAITYGWTAFWRNAGPMILITLVILVVNTILSLIGGTLKSLPLVVTFNLLTTLIGLLLGFGLIRASLAVTRGETPKIGMLFEPEGFGPYLLASIVFLVGVFVGTALCIVPGIIVSVMFMFYGYVISEHPESISPMDALRRSADLTRGHRWPLFGLVILLVLINLVGLLLCGIGILVSYGVSTLAVAYAYRRLSGQWVAPLR
jgi:uncharacterized membrane protein